jgi:conjugative transposon TraM protein
MHNKRKKLIIAVPLFLLFFSGIVYFGFITFIKPAPNTPVLQTALNNKLPEPKQPPKDLNKLELYMQAEKDSINRSELKAKDPYSPKSLPRSNTEADERKVNSRLDQLYAELNKATEPPKKQKEQKEIKEQKETKPVFIEPSLSQHPLNNPPPDPDMQQLSSMLDKLIEIQHPAKAKTKQVDSFSVVKTADNKTILAVVHQDQVVTNGATLKLRLLQDIFINGVRIPRGNFLYGICQLNSERLTVQLTNATFNNQVYPLQLHVYDIDGIEGIYMPGAINRDAAKDGADNALQSIQLSNMDPSLAAQVASAGIQTAKSLLSKKVKLVRVTAKAGHRVLLQNPFATTQ